MQNVIVKARVEIPVDRNEWAVWYSEQKVGGLLWSNSVGTYHISTIALGMHEHRPGHNAYGNYETIVFGGKIIDARRWDNWKAARSAHKWIVEDFRRRHRRGVLNGRIVMPFGV